MMINNIISHQGSTTMRYNYILIRMAKINKSWPYQVLVKMWKNWNS